MRYECWFHAQIKVLSRGLWASFAHYHLPATGCKSSTQRHHNPLSVRPSCAVRSRDSHSATPQLQTVPLFPIIWAPPGSLPANYYRGVQCSPSFSGHRPLLLSHVWRSWQLCPDSKQPFTTKETPYRNNVTRRICVINRMAVINKHLTWPLSPRCNPSGKMLVERWGALCESPFTHILLR